MEVKGFDISQWESNFSFSTVKNSEYKFAILRGGYTGYGKNRTKNKDTSFEKFYKDAKENGIAVGAYYYSCANDYSFGRSEAEFFYENCLKGKTFEYPVYIDVEEKRWQRNNKKGVTDAIIAFCETLEDKGFYVGVYSSTSWFKDCIDTARLKDYTKWLADWRKTKPDFVWPGTHMWQNSNLLQLGGDTVDSDICYINFPSIIKSCGLNGFSKQPNEPTSDKKDVYYTVQKGDTLSGIAKKYNTTVSEIARKNNIKNVNLIYPGQVFKI
jgi:GH25 family lysozyme M1 (1,4-beta-N-acetylmuramidase)